jgi:hypothetical protein
MPYEMNEGYNNVTLPPFVDRFKNVVPVCGEIDTSTYSESCESDIGLVSRLYRYKMNVGNRFYNNQSERWEWDAEPVPFSKANLNTTLKGKNCIDHTNFYPDGDKSWEKDLPQSWAAEPTRDTWQIQYYKNFTPNTNFCDNRPKPPAPTTPVPAPTTPAPTTSAPTTPAPTTPRPTVPAPAPTTASVKVVTTDSNKFPTKGTNDWKINDKVVVKSENNNVLRGYVSNIQTTFGMRFATITFYGGTPPQTNLIGMWGLIVRADNSNNSPATSLLRWF